MGHFSLRELLCDDNACSSSLSPRRIAVDTWSSRTLANSSPEKWSVRTYPATSVLGSEFADKVPLMRKSQKGQIGTILVVCESHDLATPSEKLFSLATVACSLARCARLTIKAGCRRCVACLYVSGRNHDRTGQSLRRVDERF